MLDNQSIKDILFAQNDTLEFSEENSAFLNVWVAPEELHSLGLFLRDDPRLQFDYLFCMTGVDWPTEDTLEIVCHLRSIPLGHQMVLRCKTGSRDNPELDTLSDIWPTTHMHEREIYDLFGIRFKGHTNLKRLFLDPSWDGHPLKKDYVDEVNLIVK